VFGLGRVRRSLSQAVDFVGAKLEEEKEEEVR
jgi:hypothetical protein